ncbi:MAG: DUF3429 domain-containing protein [Rhodomicrobium sp.]|nr:DUF3429 domain-containing protein [Rhodomicrobium sp.]
MTPQLGMKPAQTPPLPAIVLGLAGMIPFAAGALAVCFSPESKAEAAVALLIYGAVILSFLGGIRWGFAVLEGRGAGWTAYGLGAVPSLAAWLGALNPGPAGLLVLALALSLWFFFERVAPPALALPAWYMPLRAALTALAVLALTVAAFSL